MVIISYEKKMQNRDPYKVLEIRHLELSNDILVVPMKIVCMVRSCH